MRSTNRIAKRLALGVGCVCLVAQIVWARTWTDVTGKHRVEAVLLNVEDETAILKRASDGRVIRVPLAKLSAADRKFAVGQPKKAARPREKDRAATESSSRPSRSPRVAAGQALKHRAEASFTDVPLAEAVKTLAQQAKTNIVLDRRALEEGGISSSSPVTAEVSGSLEKVLAEVGDKLDLGLVVAHDVILLTTRQQAEALTQIRVYTLKRPMHPDRLAADIKSKIAPRSWDDAGGLGSLVWLGRAGLIVTQSWSALRKIDQAYDGVLVPLEVPANNKAALRKKISVVFIETPLKDAMEMIARHLDTKIRIDEPALVDVGLTADVPVSAELVGVPGDSVLQLILGKLDLAWARETDGILVSTLDSLTRKTQPVNYDIRGLTATPDSRDFIEALTVTVQPAAWKEVGGPASARGAGRGRIVVEAHDPLHRQIESLVATLRRKW